MKKNVYLLLIAFVMYGCTAAQQPFQVRYLGNMGIAIVYNDSCVIIDGLHDFYEKDYLPADPQAVDAMLKKQPPFAKIAAIAVTHRHSDHFDSSLVTQVARAHPKATLLLGSQARALLGSDMQKRAAALPDSTTIYVAPGLTIRVRRIPHTYAVRHAAVENYRFEVVWGGFRLVHLGDADTKANATHGLAAGPQVMIIPNWFLDKRGVELLQPVKPAQVIITHLAPGDDGMYKNDKLQAPQTVFKQYGDQIKINTP